MEFGHCEWVKSPACPTLLGADGNHLELGSLLFVEYETRV